VWGDTGPWPLWLKDGTFKTSLRGWRGGRKRGSIFTTFINPEDRKGEICDLLPGIRKQLGTTEGKGGPIHSTAIDWASLIKAVIRGRKREGVRGRRLRICAPAWPKKGRLRGEKGSTARFLIAE